MTARFSFKPGAMVVWAGKACTILEAVTSSSVLVEVTETKAKEVVPAPVLWTQDRPK